MKKLNGYYMLFKFIASLISALSVHGPGKNSVEKTLNMFIIH